MADLFDRLTYQPIRSTAPGNLPRVDFAAGREAARTSQTLAQAMDRISNYAFESAKRSQTIEGSRAGAADPKGTLLSLEDRDPSSFSFRESAAYASAVEGLSAQVEVEAKKTMGEIILDSTQKGENPQQLGERLDMAVIGFSDSLALLDPGTSQKLQLTLDNYRNAQYLNFSESYMKEQRRVNRAVGATNLDVMNQSLESMARSSMASGTMDFMIDDALVSIEAYLRGQDYSEEEIAAELIRSKKRAVIARARGEFERLDTVEEQLQFVEDFKKDIGPNKGLARGMTDATAEALANSFETQAKSARSALNGEIANLKADIAIDVSSVVKSGGVVGTQVIDKLRVRIQNLEEQGGDKARIAELKEILNSAEGNIEYFQGIQEFNIEQLEAEVQRLGSVRDEEATPDSLLRLRVAKSRLASLESEARENNLEWSSDAKAIGKSVDSLITVVERFDPIRSQDVESIKSAINTLEGKGAPPEMIAALRQDVGVLEALSESYNDVANDSSIDLEGKINRLRQRISDDGATPLESELLKNMNERLTSMRTALREDAMNWANSAGVVNIQTDLVEKIFSAELVTNADGSIGVDDFTAGMIEKRIVDANKVASHYNIAPQILTRAEASALAAAIDDQPVEQQAAMLSRVVSAFGPKALDVLEQVHKEAPLLAHIGGLIASGGSTEVVNAAMTGRLIKQGATDRAMGELSDMKMNRIRITGGVSAGSPAMATAMGRITEVADLIYLGRGGSVGGNFNNKDYERALNDAVGAREVGGEMFGGFDTYKGRNILLPSNIAQGSVGKIMKGLETMEDVLALAITQNADGRFVPYDQPPFGFGNEQDVPLSVIKKAELVSVANGVYKLMVDGYTLFAPNEQPYLIDLTKVSQ